MSVFRKRGFDAHKEESARREKEKESRQGKLWRYFLKDGEEDVPLRFLTEEPILFYEHNIKTPDGKYSTATCTGEDCEHCETSKPSYKGAWLVVDGREIEVDEKTDGKATGKKKILKDQVRLYVRGATDIAKLDRLSRKFGLTSRPWFATKTGANTSTSYELDRGEPSELSAKEIKNLLAKVPEEMREHYDGTEDSLYDIVEYNIFDDVELGGNSDESDKESSKTKTKSKKVEDDEDEDEDLDEDVSSVDDDEEEEPKPKKKSSLKKPVANKKKSVFKRK
jgi:hypothetical protein